MATGRRFWKLAEGVVRAVGTRAALRQQQVRQWAPWRRLVVQGKTHAVAKPWRRFRDSVISPPPGPWRVPEWWRLGRLRWAGGLFLGGAALGSADGSAEGQNPAAAAAGHRHTVVDLEIQGLLASLQPNMQEHPAADEAAAAAPLDVEVAEAAFAGVEEAAVPAAPQAGAAIVEEAADERTAARAAGTADAAEMQLEADAAAAAATADDEDAVAALLVAGATTEQAHVEAAQAEVFEEVLVVVDIDMEPQPAAAEIGVAANAAEPQFAAAPDTAIVPELAEEVRGVAAASAAPEVAAAVMRVEDGAVAPAAPAEPVGATTAAPPGPAATLAPAAVVAPPPGSLEALVQDEAHMQARSLPVLHVEAPPPHGWREHEFALEDIQIVRHVAHGGNGMVFEVALHNNPPGSPQRYALKLCYHYGLTATPLVRQYSKCEYEQLERMARHNNITRFYCQFVDVISEDIMPYLQRFAPVVAELAEQGKKFQYLLLDLHDRSLEQLMQERRAVETDNTPLVVSVVLDVGRALLHCLQHGVLHLDLKPENVLVDRGARAILCDFGCARCFESSDRLLLPAHPALQGAPLWGNLAHVSPELLNASKQQADFDFDGQPVFELGVLGLEVLLGHHPLGDYPCDEVAVGVERLVLYDEVNDVRDRYLPTIRPNARGLFELLCRMIAFDPRRRPCLEEVLADLQGLLRICHDEF